MSSSDAVKRISCPACGHAAALNDLLDQFELRHHERLGFVDGSLEDARSSWEQRCACCHHGYPIPFKLLASLIIERQTRDLFASIGDVLRAGAKLQ